MFELLRQKVVTDLLVSEVLLHDVPGTDTGTESVGQRAQGVAVAPVHLLRARLKVGLLLVQRNPAEG